MKLMEGKSKTEQYKFIAAIVLGVIAIGLIGYLFFGDSIFGSSTPNKTTVQSSPTPRKQQPQKPTDPDPVNDGTIAAVVYSPMTAPAVAGGRNIFDIYVPPPPTPTPTYIPPTPTPRPFDFLVSSVSPGNVYAKTGDFTIQANGDKFTPETRISFDNNDLPTKFISPQQLSATVPASFIAMDGARQIMVRTPDGKLYSNTATLNVMAPPMPNYLYVGIIGDKRYKDDVALMRDKNKTQDLFSVKLGDTINEKTEDRFKVLSISEKEVVVMDKILKIRHTLPYTVAGDKNSSGNNSDAIQPPNRRGFPQGEIPGIPSNIPRYQPPQQQKIDEEDDDEDKPVNVKRP